MPRDHRRCLSPDPARRLTLAAAAGMTLGMILPARVHAQPVKSVGWRRGEQRYGAGSQTRARRLLLWYPAAGEDRRFDYDGQIGRVAPDAPVAPGRHPLLLFSHGYLGAADQSIFITENLARMGYIVAPIDHADRPGRAVDGGIVAFAPPGH